MNLLPHQQIQAEAIEKLQKELLQFEEFLAKYRNSYPVMVQVAEKMCEWAVDRDKRFWLRDMFESAGIPVLSTDGFLEGTRLFLINTCLDDSSFRIEWKAPSTLMWLSHTRNGYKTLESTSEPRAMPEIREDPSGDGDSDPALLLEAMNEKEQRELKIIADRIELEKEKNRLLDKLMGRVR